LIGPYERPLLFVEGAGVVMFGLAMVAVGIVISRYMESWLGYAF